MIEVKLQFATLSEMIGSLGPLAQTHTVEPPAEAPPSVSETPAEPTPQPTDSAEETDDEREQLLAQAKELGISVRANAKTETIRKRIEAARQPSEPKTQTESQQPTADADNNVAATLDDVREVLGRVNEAKGMPAVTALVHSFDVSRISELPKEQYAEFIQRCEQEVA